MSAFNQPLTDLAAMARRVDPDRFLCAMFAPAPLREALFALIGFNDELARVRETVSEPMVGRIRLQWWKDAIIEAAAGKPPQRHEIFSPLAEAMRQHQLPSALLLAMVDFRLSDLEERSFANMADLEAYAEASAAPMLELWQRILGQPDADYARKVGGAYALTGHLRALPYYRSEGRLVLPDELFGKHGLLRSEVLAGRQREMLPMVIRDVAEQAQTRLKSAHGSWAALARLYLRQLRKTRYDVYDPRHAAQHPMAAAALLWDAFLSRRAPAPQPVIKVEERAL